MATSSLGFGNGSGRSNTESITLKIALFAPMPRARVKIAMMVKPGAFNSIRNAYLRSLNINFIPHAKPAPDRRLLRDGQAINRQSSRPALRRQPRTGTRQNSAPASQPIGFALVEPPRRSPTRRRGGRAKARTLPVGQHVR